MNRKPYERPRILAQGHLDEWQKGSPFPLLSSEELAELGALAQGKGRAPVSVPANALAELVRLYSQISRVAQALDHIGRIGEALEAQVAIADGVAESVLRGANRRFEILLHWASANPEIVHARWHETPGGLRWGGTFEEAEQIISSDYGPKRGTEAFIVIRSLP